MELIRTNLLSNYQWTPVDWANNGGLSIWLYKKQTLYAIGGGFMIYLAGKAYMAYKRMQRRKRWSAAERDLVILHQLQRGKITPSLSPYALKLETYLRMTGISYECDFEEPMGPKGKTPWITINGEEIADSQLIVEYLGQKFDKDFSRHLTPEQRAICRAFHMMTDEHLNWPLAMWRWVYNPYSVPDFQEIPFTVRLLMPLVSWKMKKYCYGQGIGRHTHAEIIEIGIKDCKAISTYLGQKAFFMGDEPCEIDCVIFAMMLQFLWNAPGSPYEQLLNEELVNLKEYCLRMKERFWPDWDRNLYPPRM